MFTARTTRLLLTTAGLLAAWPAAAHADPVLVSRASGPAGAPANAAPPHEIPVHVDTSRTGRFVVFTSDATNLVPGGLPSGASSVQVYLRDLALGTTELVSRASGPSGAPSSGSASHPSVSDDGRFVAFQAYGAENLAPGSATDGRRVYVRDLATGTTRKLRDDVSDNTPGNAESWDPDLSGDGRTVAYTTSGYTWQGGAPTVVTASTDGTDALQFVATPPEGWPSLPSTAPSISRDGQRVAYVDAGQHVVVADLAANTRTIVDQAASGSGDPGNGAASDPAISADGFAVTFLSAATDLVPETAGTPAARQVYLRRLGAAPRTELVSVAPSGGPLHASALPSTPSIAENGDAVAFSAYGLEPGTASHRLYVRAMSTGVTTAVLPVPAAAGTDLEHVLAAQLTPDGMSVGVQSGQSNLSSEDLDPGVDAFLVEAAPLSIREPAGPRRPDRQPIGAAPLRTLAPGVLRRLVQMPRQRAVCRTRRLTLTLQAGIEPAINGAAVTVRWGKRGRRTVHVHGQELHRPVQIGKRPRGPFTVTVQLAGDGLTGSITRRFAACTRR